jgi:DNA-binding MarR family transcriptional regulator
VIEDSLGYRVNRLARTMASALADQIRPSGVGIGQWAVLLILWAEDGASQAELSRLVAIEPPTMVHTLNRMERDGLVTRSPDPVDRRVARIHLTERGQSLRDVLIPLARDVNAATLAPLTPAERRTLHRLLAKLEG